MMQSLTFLWIGLASSIRGRFPNKLSVVFCMAANGGGQLLAEFAERLQATLPDQIDDLGILGGLRECAGELGLDVFGRSLRRGVDDQADRGDVVAKLGKR